MRCKWCNLKNDLYIDYHDKEWGILTNDEHTLYEMFILETFQAGLSWECILNKRESFRKAYDNFDIDKVIKYDSKKVEDLLNNKDIIRNKLKINASIKNSIIYKEIVNEYGSFYKYLTSYIKEIIYENNKTTNIVSDNISKDLIKRGMSFVGSTTIYSYLQAIGLINSHDKDCFKYPNIKVIAFDFVGVLSYENDNLNEEESKLERLFGPNLSDKDYLEKASSLTNKDALNLTKEIINKVYTIKDKDIFTKIKKKYKDIKIIIASNHVSYIKDYIKSNMDTSYLDDIIISADISKVKPNSDFFKYILDKYDLKPNNLLFLDDNDKNIIGASKEGIITIKVNKNTNIIKEIEKVLDLQK